MAQPPSRDNLPNEPWSHQGLLFLGEQGFSTHGPEAQSLHACIWPFDAELARLPIGVWQGQRLWLAEPRHEAGDAQVALRGLMPGLGADEFAILARAQGLYLWLNQHRFCASCGGPLRLVLEPLSQACCQCDRIWFPAVAPCVIGLVTRGRQLLLARHVRQGASQRYSLLAGFIEPGESAEAAFAREVCEEVGVQIQACTYVQSQAWPFPGQLMLGFRAEYAGGDFVLDAAEIADAQWFEPDALPEISPAYSIAGQLIRNFVASLGLPPP